jgi:hypothetical protein
MYPMKRIISQKIRDIKFLLNGSNPLNRNLFGVLYKTFF